MGKRIAAAIAATFAFAFSASAQQVTIRALDDTIVLRGDLIKFDAENYELRTGIGVISIPTATSVCEGAGCPPEDFFKSNFKITGTSVVSGELILRLIEGYALEQQAEVMVNFDPAERVMRTSLKGSDAKELADIGITTASADQAFQSLLQRDSTMVLSARQATLNEQSRFASAGREGVTDPENEFVLALDGLAIVVADQNVLRGVTLDEIAAIFSGRINNWAAFGGPDQPIRVLIPTDTGDTFDFFNQSIMAPRGARVAIGAEQMAREDALADAVAADPFAIGVTTFAFAERAKPLPIRLSCGLTAQPSAFAVKAEEYPLARRLFLYSEDGGLPLHARKFLEYARTELGQDDIARAGFVDQRVATRTIDNLGMRFASALVTSSGAGDVTTLRRMATELINAERLSTTLRFQSGASLLDSKAQTDVERLAELFTQDEFAGREILLVGFTDSVGRLDLNVILANRRAEQVRDSIIAASGGTLSPNAITTLGFGPIAPVGCNDTLAGRQVNRRVEVWVRDKI